MPHPRARSFLDAPAQRARFVSAPERGCVWKTSRSRSDRSRRAQMFGHGKNCAHAAAGAKAHSRAPPIADFRLPIIICQSPDQLGVSIAVDLDFDLFPRSARFAGVALHGCTQLQQIFHLLDPFLESTHLTQASPVR